MKMKPHAWQRKLQGSILLEVSMGFALLIIVSLLLMKLSMVALANRSWVVQQTFSDAYCTKETALAKRIPFNTLTKSNSEICLWPTGVENAVTKDVVMGKLGNGAGNTSVTGTVKRFKEPINVALPAGADVDNPASVESYLVQSVLSYKIHGQTYYKTRSTIRTK
ncbi:MAG: hypothetical protein RL693_2101 [Verrucomicrobiota bacterium]|jgi:hypothetical protein